MNFADTNWLEALYFDAEGHEQRARCQVVQRFIRRHAGQLAISYVVYLEARNVFSRNSGEAEPEDWRRLVSDLNRLIYLDPFHGRVSGQIDQLFKLPMSNDAPDLMSCPNGDIAILADLHHLESFSFGFKNIPRCAPI